MPDIKKETSSEKMKKNIVISKNDRYKLIFTFTLVLLESSTMLFIPLAIGKSIEGLLSNSYQGLILLIILMLLGLIFSSGRRFYDTRFYAKAYARMAYNIVVDGNRKNVSVSKISAKTMLLEELIEFFEDPIPEMINALFNLIGVLSIMYFLDYHVFLACVASFIFFFAIYGVSGKKMYRLNRAYNTQLEEQVDAIDSKVRTKIKSHLQRMMKWSIKLSDLETINFSFLWLGLTILLPYSIFIASKSSSSQGEIFSILIYVYEFVLLIVALPVSIDKFIRFREILSRLRGDED